MTELEKELRAAKIKNIKLLAAKMVSLKFNEYKDYEIPKDKDIPYLNAMIDMLTKAVDNAELTKAKLIKFDKLEADRANLSDEELEKLTDAQKRNAEITDSFLATLEPRASLKGKIYAPNSTIIRFRGHGVDSEFRKKYPLGVLL